MNFPVFCLPGVLEDEISEERHTAGLPPPPLLAPEQEVSRRAVTPDQLQSVRQYFPPEINSLHGAKPALSPAQLQHELQLLATVD